MKHAAPPARGSVAGKLDEIRYRALQGGILVSSAAAHRLLARVQGDSRPPPPEAFRLLRGRYEELLRRDVENVHRGIYPRELLFQFPWRSYALKLPALAREVPRALRRREGGDYAELPTGVDLTRFPPYFRRTFHWQTDGYLSERSAALYDVSVEFLFLGTADVMRRQILPAVARHVRAISAPEPARLLDIGCGTGRTLLQIARAFPHLRLSGLDISPFYIQRARKVLERIPDVSLMAENAEALPTKDDVYDVATSVFLFHELPRNARRNVAKEMFRVLRRGGLLVVSDSAQLSESGELRFFLENFGRTFHEPFYRDYLDDDLGSLLREVGFDIVESAPHFVSKVVVARKPV